MSTVWKIVRQVDGDWRSLVAPGAASVRYAVGEWASAPHWLARKGLFLTAFDSMPRAQSFLFCQRITNDGLKMTEVAIFSCEAELVPVHQASKQKLEKGYLINEETTIFPAKRTPLWGKWPHGTLFCSRLKLQRREYFIMPDLSEGLFIW